MKENLTLLFIEVVGDTYILCVELVNSKTEVDMYIAACANQEDTEATFMKSDVEALNTEVKSHLAKSLMNKMIVKQKKNQRILSSQSFLQKEFLSSKQIDQLGTVI